MSTPPGQTINPSYWQASPLFLIMLAFLVFPVGVIVTVSFWDYDSYELIPDFIWDNYQYLLTSKVNCLTKSAVNKMPPGTTVIITASSLLNFLFN